MTTEEILEAFEKVRADMTEDLSGITAACTADAENLVDIVEEKVTSLLGGLQQVARLLWSTAPEPRDFENGRAGTVSRLISRLEMAVIVVYAPTQTLKGQPINKAKLIETEAKHVPRVRSALDEIAQFFTELELN